MFLTDPLTPDTRKSPGDAEVKGVGSLLKTNMGFVMEVLSGTGPIASFGAAGLEVSGPPHRTKDVFRVNEEDKI